MSLYLVWSHHYRLFTYLLSYLVFIFRSSSSHVNSSQSLVTSFLRNDQSNVNFFCQCVFIYYNLTVLKIHSIFNVMSIFLSNTSYFQMNFKRIGGIFYSFFESFFKQYILKVLYMAFIFWLLSYFYPIPIFILTFLFFYVQNLHVDTRTECALYSLRLCVLLFIIENGQINRFSFSKYYVSQSYPHSFDHTMTTLTLNLVENDQYWTVINTFNDYVYGKSSR